MTTDTLVTESRTEFSKVWANNNPELFTAAVISLVEEHPQPEWSIEVTSTPGFMFFTSTRV